VDIIAVLVKNGWFLGGQTDAKGGQNFFLSFFPDFFIIFAVSK